MAQHKSLIQRKVSKYVTSLLACKLPPNLLFHNLHHTISVVMGVRKISDHCKVNSAEKEILILAAWFHDTGHVYTYKGHEIESQKIAKAFLEKEEYPDNRIQKVLRLVEVTKMPQKPVSLLEQIICDADLYHLSVPEYANIQYLLREEWNRVFNKKFTNEEWQLENGKFLLQHKYFTDYGKSVLEKKKITNMVCETYERESSKGPI